MSAKNSYEAETYSARNAINVQTASTSANDDSVKEIVGDLKTNLKALIEEVSTPLTAGDRPSRENSSPSSSLRNTRDYLTVFTYLLYVIILIITIIYFPSASALEEESSGFSDQYTYLPPLFSGWSAVVFVSAVAGLRGLATWFSLTQIQANIGIILYLLDPTIIVVGGIVGLLQIARPDNRDYWRAWWRGERESPWSGWKSPHEWFVWHTFLKHPMWNRWIATAVDFFNFASSFPYYGSTITYRSCARFGAKLLDLINPIVGEVFYLFMLDREEMVHRMTNEIKKRFMEICENISVPITVLVTMIKGNLSPFQVKLFSLVDHVGTLIAQYMQSKTQTAAILSFKSFLDIIGLPDIHVSNIINLVKDRMSVRNFVPIGFVSDVAASINNSEFRLDQYPIIADIIVLATTAAVIPQFLKGGLSITDVMKNIDFDTKQWTKKLPIIVVITGAITRLATTMVNRFGKDNLIALPDEIHEWFESSISLEDRFYDMEKVTNEPDPTSKINNAISDLMSLNLEGKKLLTTRVLDEAISPTLRAQMMTQLANNTALLGKLKVFINATQVRSEPAVVTIVGTPGIGKTLLTQLIIQQHATKFGYKPDPCKIYNIRSEEDFYSGMNHGKVYGILDDPQFFKADTVGVDTNVANLGHVVNNAAFSPNMADLSEKGAYQILFKLLVISTNVPGFGLTHLANDAYALKRRNKYLLEVFCRDEYKDIIGNTTALANKHFNDAYYYHKYRPHRDPNFSSTSDKWRGYEIVEAPSGGHCWTPVELFRDLSSYFLEHEDSQQKYLESMTTTYELCHVHEVLSFVCGCARSDIDEIKETKDITVEIKRQLLTKSHRDKLIREEILDAIQSYRVNIFDKSIPVAIPLALTATSVGAFAMHKYYTDPVEVADSLADYNISQVPVPVACATTTRDTLLAAIDKNLVLVECISGSTAANVIGLHVGNGFYIVPTHGLHGRTHMKLKKYNSEFDPESIPIKSVQVGDDLSVVRYLGIPPPTPNLKKFLLHQPFDKSMSHTLITCIKGMEKPRTHPVNTRESINVLLKHSDDSTYRLSGLYFNKPSLIGGNSGSPVVQNLSGRGYGIGAFAVAARSKDPGFIASQVDLKLLDEAMILLKDEHDPDIMATASIGDYSWNSFNYSTKPINPVYSTPYYNTAYGYVEPEFDHGARFRNSRDSKCRKTRLADHLPFLDPDQFVVPNFKTRKIDGVYDNERSPLTVNVRYLMEHKPLPRDDILNEVTEELFQFYKKAFKDTGEYYMYNLNECINGAPGLEAIQFNTSAGYPYMGPKSNILDGNHIDGYTLKPEILEDFYKYLDISEEFCLQFPFVANHKDEVSTEAKNSAGKTRVFTGSSILPLLKHKSVFGWFVSNFKKLNLQVESAWGLSSEDEWTQIFHLLLSNNNNQDEFIAGDYSKFDKRLHVNVLIKTLNIIIRIMKEHDTEQRLPSKLVSSSVREIVYLLVLINGDGYYLSGTNGSGQYLTTLINIIANSLLHRYCFKIISPDRHFDEDVTAFYYGDDSILTSKNPHYNQSSIQKAMESFGMVYTDANKNSDCPPYVDSKNVTFLGRRFGAWRDMVVSPLRGSAWVKQLCWLSPATNTDEIDRFLSMWPVLLREISKMKICDLEPDEDQAKVLKNLDAIVVVINNIYDLDVSLPDNWEDYYLETDKMFDSMLYYDDSERVLTGDDFFPTSGLAESSTNQNDAQIIRNPVLTFRNQFETEVEEDMGNRFQASIDTEASLNKIMDRPIKIHQFTWGDATNVGFSYMLIPIMLKDAVFAPFANSYDLFRYKKVRVTVATTGNFNSQGLLAVGAMPMRPEWACSSTPLATTKYGGFNTVTTDIQTRTADAVSRMQVTAMPGIFPGVDIGLSETASFDIPYVAPELWSRTQTAASRSAILGGDPRDQVNFLTLVSMGPLRNANLVANSADVVIYAQFIGLEFAAPRFVPTAGLEEVQNEERAEDGVVTKTINKVGEIADQLTSLPMIGGVAGTISKIAKIGGKITHLFGWSTPLLVDPITRTVRVPIESMAAVDAPSGAMSLSVFQGTQIPVDPLSLGLGPVDSMSINTINRLWSLINVSVVNAQTPAGTAIFGVVVSPTHQITSNVEAIQGFQPTHQAFVAKPMTWWRDTPEYLIRGIMAASMRLRISISFSAYSDSHSTEPSNQQYNAVVDLIQGENILIQTTWLRAEPCLRIQKYNNLGGGIIDVNNITFDPDYHAGTLEVNVLNPMVAPNATAAAEICLFQRGGLDCMYSVPENGQYNDFFPISSESIVYPSQERFDQPCIVDNESQPIVFGQPESATNLAQLSKMNFGERVNSLRELVKRYSYYGTLTTATPVAHTNAMMKSNLGWYPNPHLPSAIKSDFTLTAEFQDQHNFRLTNGWGNESSILSYLRPAYQGWKGSIRHMANFWETTRRTDTAPRAQRGTEVLFQASLANTEKTECTFNSFGIILPVTTNNPFPQELGGNMVTNYTLGSLNYEVPYYANTFYSATCGSYYFPSDGSLDRNDGLRVNTHSINLFSSTDMVWDHYVAAGDDFDLIYYTGPPYWYEDQVSA